MGNAGAGARRGDFDTTLVTISRSRRGLFGLLPLLEKIMQHTALPIWIGPARSGAVNLQLGAISGGGAVLVSYLSTRELPLRQRLPWF